MEKPTLFYTQTEADMMAQRDADARRRFRKQGSTWGYWALLLALVAVGLLGAGVWLR